MKPCYLLVVKPTNIRVILTLALTYEWQIRQIDINNVFLNSELKEKVYMQQPLAFVNFNLSLVCMLKNDIYGIKQTPRTWYEKLPQT